MPQLSSFGCCSSLDTHIKLERTDPWCVSQHHITMPFHESSVIWSCATARVVPTPTQQNQHHLEDAKNADPQSALGPLESELECY